MTRANEKTTVRRLTDDERRQLHEDVKSVTGEVINDAQARAKAAKAALPAAGAGVRGALVRIGRSARSAALAFGGLFTRDNLDAAMTASGAFARLAVRYGVDEVRAAVLREVQQRVQRIFGRGAIGVGGSNERR